MKSLVALLKKTAGLKGWQVSRLSKNSTEVYYVGRELETVRCNAVSNYTLRVQTPCEDNFMGESATRFQGKPVSLNALVEETKERAELVKNPAYRFAESSPLLSAIHPPIDDIQIRNADLDTLIAVGVKAQEYRQKHLARFPLNSLELFFEEYTLDIQNHRGLICHTPSTRLVCDYVLTSPDNAHEIMGIKKRRFLSDLCIEEEWENDARILSDLTQATLPPTG
ncbi:MAG TPA: hypothetical protein PLY93_13865, partial [Turneriella sp.]|nr:hypothetical protein [Turneriella sp.]